MQKIKVFFAYIFIFEVFTFLYPYKYDLTILGQLNYNGSLSRAGICLVDCLYPFLKINYIRTSIGLSQAPILGPVSNDVKNIILNKDKSPGKVSLFIETLGFKPARTLNKNIKSIVKIAYSMLESTQIPRDWVLTLNTDFDAVVVPDNFLVNVYKNCGVKIPIFEIPLCMYLDDFLKSPLKTSANKPFTFGVAATFIDRKNNGKLVDAFIQEFGNNNDVRLKIHGRYGNLGERIEKKVKRLNIKNVKLSQKPINQEQYIKFLSSIDCYVCISKGEGFSLTPREAMALGIPCIITDNTAQSTICRSGLVEIVPSKIKESFIFQDKFCGYCFDCDTVDVRRAMRKVYKNYPNYLKRNLKYRVWVKKYNIKSLSKLFLNLIKPKKVILGDVNLVNKDFIQTNSKMLYYKYLKVKKSKTIDNNFFNN